MSWLGCRTHNGRPSGAEGEGGAGEHRDGAGQRGDRVALRPAQHRPVRPGQPAAGRARVRVVAVLAGTDTSVPKSSNGHVESMRILMSERR